MEYYENRLRTFDTYPPQMVPDKYEVAKAGFYYTGLSDRVICFRCDIKLKDWEKYDNAMNEHDKCLAKAEFFYTNVGDKVTCFSCGKTLFQWKSSDNPWAEHSKHSKDCEYIKMVGGDPSHHIAFTNHKNTSSNSFSLWS
ncbi:baculoviral IAP repeat-containing protein 3-like [Mya arenaria]|uniref:baculoviral IAP repeat-containing protein 3-like n=1 Tax=Mya arenaria TaxID=6604 RepID=UPI0022E7227F|nr:baculoviral IAP repeat-containing protein 3-like [Mya arenaria]